MDKKNKNDNPLIGKKIETVPKPELEIGIDTKDTIFNDIINGVDSSTIDITTINNFTNISQNREQIYQLLDTMAQDSIISAILETYAEDSTTTNDKGHIMWVESDDPNVQKYISYVLDSFNVDKHAYNWVYSLCKYGDLYLKLFRESDFKDDLFDNKSDIEVNQKLNEALDVMNLDENKNLKEEIIVKAYSSNDKFALYLEKVPNPAELFELTRFGRTYAYIEAPTATLQTKDQQLVNNYYQYQFKQSDVNIYNAVSFVHGALEDNSSRTPEKVEIFKGESEDGKAISSTYSVRRGQSLLYDAFKIWRILTLLENSLMLNRLTRSSITRILNVEVGDMPKEQVSQFLRRIKQMIEQKTSMDVGNSMSEYTNPGPSENIIYIPSYNGKGVIQAQEVGGEVNPGQLTDIEYFKNKLFGALKVPKQFFCLRGNTPILLLNGHKATIEDLYNDKEKYIGKGILACDELGNLIPTTIENIMLTKPKAEFIRITLDNGKFVDCTPEHRILMRNGQFKQAKDISIDESIMPYYDQLRQDGKGYRRYVLDNASGKWKAQFRLVAESVGNIPSGYQVHHKDMNKLNDDFDNLEVLSVQDHYAKHFDSLHNASREASVIRKENGVKTAQYGKRSITNGIENHWIDDGAEIPDGFWYGQTCNYSTEDRNLKSERMSDLRTGVPSWNAGLAGKNDPRVVSGTQKMMTTKEERRKQGLYDDQYAKQSELAKSMNFAKIGHDAKMAKVPENRKFKEFYVRCACCHKVFKIQQQQDWYDKYLNMDKLWYCSDECAQIDGRGKLCRSYKLYKDSDYDMNQYEYNRWHLEGERPDTYFKASTLDSRLQYLNDYDPKCNHKIINIEYLDVIEPAYDITVNASCHTFVLPCGMVVHNCETDDSTGFNGGTSLSIISARYAKTIKRIQNTFIQAITDAVNLILLDKGLSNYINRYSLKMVAPETQEDLDRIARKENKISMISQAMSLFTLENNSATTKILKAFLTDVIDDPEIIEVLNEEIEKMEKSEEDANAGMEDTGEFDDEFEPETTPRPSMSGGSEMPTEPSTNEPSELPSEGSEEELPTPAELGVGDFTDTANLEI